MALHPSLMPTESSPRLCAASDPSGFASVAEADCIGDAFTRPHQPCVIRGAVADWPAIRRWDFDYLASLAPALPVQLVVGNRERGKTRFASSTLGEYLAGLQASPAPQAEPRHLKEFDLLKTFPQLRNDLRPRELFPRGSIVSCCAWIGPAHARTGLHYDRLDNIATLIAGRKRFYLASPETTDAWGEISDKHDRWAVLSRIDIDELASRCPGAGGLYAIDLQPGDALYVPAGWWHEVVNLEPTILLSGFFGSKPRVIGQWLYTGTLQAAHAAGLWRKGHCTCHG